VTFKLNACRNGACLSYQDWKCGFDIGPSEAFRACFDAAVESVKPWETLERLIKFCGNRTKQFVGPTLSSPEYCKNAGGEWGVKSTPPKLKF